jgi:hypothetical protein
MKIFFNKLLRLFSVSCVLGRLEFWDFLRYVFESEGVSARGAAAASGRAGIGSAKAFADAMGIPSTCRAVADFRTSNVTDAMSRAC